MNYIRTILKRESKFQLKEDPNRFYWVDLHQIYLQIRIKLGKNFKIIKNMCFFF